MALADAAFRQSKVTGVDSQEPSSYHRAHELLKKAKYFYQKEHYGNARLYAIEARQTLEKAELRVLERAEKLPLGDASDQPTLSPNR
jgi:hypothetical protein